MTQPRSSIYNSCSHAVGFCLFICFVFAGWDSNPEPCACWPVLYHSLSIMGISCSRQFPLHFVSGTMGPQKAQGTRCRPHSHFNLGSLASPTARTFLTDTVSTLKVRVWKLGATVATPPLTFQGLNWGIWMVWTQWGWDSQDSLPCLVSGWHGAREPPWGGGVQFVHLGILWLA